MSARFACAIITISGVIFMRSIFSISTSISIMARKILRTIFRLSSCFCFSIFFCVFGEAFLFAPKENCRDSLRPRSRANHARSGRRCLHQYFYLLFYDLIFPTPHHHARRRKKFDEFSSMKREDLSASSTASWLREIFKNRIYARDLRFIASG